MDNCCLCSAEKEREPARERNLRSSYLLPLHPARLLKVGQIPILTEEPTIKEREEREREVGEELRVGGKLMERLDREQVDVRKRTDGWRAGGKSHGWLLHPLSAY